MPFTIPLFWRAAFRIAEKKLRVEFRRFYEVLSILTFSVGLSFAGSFVSGLVMFSEGKIFLLSFLLIPVCVPVLIPSVVATDEIIGGVAIMDVIPELRRLIVFLLITAMTTLIFEFVLEDAKNEN